MGKLVMAVWAASLGIGMISGQEVGGRSEKLVQYVLDAKHQGVQDLVVKQKAMAAGWSATAIDEALAYVNSAENKETRVAASNSESASPAPEAAIPERPSRTATRQAPTSKPASLDTAGGARDTYEIGAGDVLQISVWKEPDASVPSVVVRPDGKIAMPLLKEVEVAGLTPTQVEKVITERLSQLINTPDVTVLVTAVNSKRVYIVGAAKKEGPLAYTYRMNIMQAIAESGGLTEYAKRRKIYVLRTDNGKEYRLPFNYDEVIKGEHLDQNIQLLPGDTVVIPH